MSKPPTIRAALAALRHNLANMLERWARALRGGGQGEERPGQQPGQRGGGQGEE